LKRQKQLKSASRQDETVSTESIVDAYAKLRFQIVSYLQTKKVWVTRRPDGNRYGPVAAKADKTKKDDPMQVDAFGKGGKGGSEGKKGDVKKGKDGKNGDGKKGDPLKGGQGC
jgi:hypothetical protein